MKTYEYSHCGKHVSLEVNSKDELKPFIKKCNCGASVEPIEVKHDHTNVYLDI